MSNCTSDVAAKFILSIYSCSCFTHYQISQLLILKLYKVDVRPGLGFGEFHSAKRTLQGYEAMNMIRKGQIEGVTKCSIEAQVKFIDQLFDMAA